MSGGWRWVLAALIVLLAGCADGPSAPSKASTSIRMRDLVLASGLRVLVEEDHASPTSGVAVVVGSGSTADPVGKEGLAHLVEHLTFLAHPVADRTVQSLLEQAGAGSWNAFTNLDDTTYYAFGPRDALADLLSIESLLVDDPLASVDENSFLVEREVVRNELRQRTEMSWSGQASGALLEALFPSPHPYARPPIGTHASLDASTLEDARAFVRKHYRPENATLIVIGDVDAARIEAMLSERLPPKITTKHDRPLPPAKRLPDAAPAVPAPADAHLRTVESFVPGPELWVAWSTPRSFDTSSYMQGFATQLLLAAAARAEDEDIVDTSPLVIDGVEASVVGLRISLRDGSHAEETAEHVLNQIAPSIGPGSGRRNAAQMKALDELRSRSVTSLLFWAENQQSRAIGRAVSTHFTGDSQLFRRRLRALEEIDYGAVSEFEATWFTRARARTVLLKPVQGSRADNRTALETRSEESAADAVKPDIGSLSQLAIPIGAAKMRAVSLENGMELIVAKHGSLPIATALLSFHGAGSNGRERAAATLAAELSRAGRARRGTYSSIGANVSTHDSEDAFTFVVQVPADRLSDALGVLRDHASSLEVEERAVLDYRRFRLPRIAKGRERGAWTANHTFYELVEGNAYGRLPSIAELESAEAKDANAWLEKTIRGENARLVIVGGIDEKVAEEAARKWFADLPRGTRTVAPNPPALAASPRVLTTAIPGATQAFVRVGCTLPPPDAEKHTEYRLLASVLRTKATEALRVGLGATYGVSGGAVTFAGGTSRIAFETSIDNGKLAVGLRKLHELFASVDTVTDAAIDSARWSTTIQYNLSLSTSGSIAHAAARTRALGFSLAVLDDTAAETRASAKSIRDIYATCLHGLVVSVAGDDRVVPTATRASGF